MTEEDLLDLEKLRNDALAAYEEANQNPDDSVLGDRAECVMTDYLSVLDHHSEQLIAYTKLLMKFVKDVELENLG